MDGRLRLAFDLDLFYRVDARTDSRRDAPSLLFIHGIGESGEAWNTWLPHFAPGYRTIRIDLRGFGRSTPMPEDFSWSLELLANDLIAAIGQLAPSGAHLVAAKFGGAIAVRAARLRPDLVASLTLAGTPMVGPDTGPAIAQIRREGLRAWARGTMRARMGPDMDEATLDWWVALMAATPLSTILGFLRFAATVDVTELLPGLACPALVLATDSGRRALSEFASWQRRIPRSAIVPVPGGGYHAAACNPDFCARAVIDFLGGLAESAAPIAAGRPRL